MNQQIEQKIEEMKESILAKEETPQGETLEAIRERAWQEQVALEIATQHYSELIWEETPREAWKFWKAWSAKAVNRKVSPLIGLIMQSWPTYFPYSQERRQEWVMEGYSVDPTDFWADSPIAWEDHLPDEEAVIEGRCWEVKSLEGEMESLINRIGQKVIEDRVGLPNIEAGVRLADLVTQEGLTPLEVLAISDKKQVGDLLERIVLDMIATCDPQEQVVPIWVGQWMDTKPELLIKDLPSKLVAWQKSQP